MIIIKINHTEPNRYDMVNYLDHIARLLEQGYPKGEDWSVEEDYSNNETQDDANSETKESEETMEGLYQETEYLEEQPAERDNEI